MVHVEIGSDEQGTFHEGELWTLTHERHSVLAPALRGIESRKRKRLTIEGSGFRTWWDRVGSVVSDNDCGSPPGRWPRSPGSEARSASSSLSH